MTAKVTITWNEAEFERLSSENGLVGRAVKRAAGRIRDRAKMNLTSDGSVDTGLLRQSVQVGNLTTSTNGGAKAEVGTGVEYAKWVHDGRGPVVPRRAKVLRFKPKGSGAFVFARQVGPAKGTKFLLRAMESTSQADFEP